MADSGKTTALFSVSLMKNPVVTAPTLPRKIAPRPPIAMPSATAKPERCFIATSAAPVSLPVNYAKPTSWGAKLILWENYASCRWLIPCEAVYPASFFCFGCCLNK